ncbi:MAG: alpha/beta fold hydrolase [Planctomycetota bacterium]|jgi:predicted esterase
MKRAPALFVAPLFFVTLSWAPLAGAADVKEREPSTRGDGKLYEWHSEDGLVYWYRVPKKYDHEKGANLTLILHGSNLTHEWGFANHSKDSFRPDDIVVSPDGTTSNGSGGFNFLGVRTDAKRLKALQDELLEVFNVRNTYIYGHSQGSFFAFYYAGEYPEEVDGVVGHASGVWTQTQQSRKGHHQALVLMHGTQDPVVPYGQSVGGYESYVENKYPMVRLCSLENWNHWPAEHNGPVPHT